MNERKFLEDCSGNPELKAELSEGELKAVAGGAKASPMGGLNGLEQNAEALNSVSVFPGSEENHKGVRQGGFI